MAIYNKKKQFDKALKEANIVIGICEKDPSIKGIALSYKDRAYIYQNLGEFDKAEKDFKKVIALLEPLEDKGSKILLGGTYATLSTFYLKQKKYKQVIAKSKKAIEISKELTPPFARLNMGEAYSAIGDHKNAISTYEEAIKIHKNFQKAYQLCSAEYKKLGNKKKAAEYLAKYEELEKKGNSEESRKSM